MGDTLKKRWWLLVGSAANAPAVNADERKGGWEECKNGKNGKKGKRSKEKGM